MGHHPLADTSGPGTEHDGAVLPAWSLGLVAAVGLAVRLWLLRTPLGVLDADEAVGGLIARHFLEGELTVFLWGNRWGGTLEAIVTAAVFALIGSSVAALKLVMVGFYAAACFLTWRTGRHVVGEGSARLAAALLWLFPGAMVLLSIKARLYYGAAMVIATGIVLLALRLRDRAGVPDVLGLGLLSGLGLWTAPFVFYVAVPVGLWLLFHNPRLWRWAPLAVPGLVLGALPWIVFNLQRGFVSLDEPEIPVATSYLGRLAGFVTHLLPTMLGLRLNASMAWVAGPAGIGLYVAALAGLVWLAFRYRRRLAPLLVVVAGFPLIFAIPRSSHYVAEPRYGLVLAPVVMLLLAYAVRRRLRTVWPQLGVLAAATLATVVATTATVDFTERVPRQQDVAPPPLGPLVAELERHDVRAVYSDYWISYRLSFETREEIIASPIDSVRYGPHDGYVREVAERAQQTTYVVHGGAQKDTALQATLEERGLAYERRLAGDFAVYYVDAFLPPETLETVKFVP